MAQNITFLGASYSNVPAVELPKTGGGTASFTDVSDTTAVAAQVAEGAYFYTAAGVKTEGTATGGSMVIRDEPDSHGGTIRHITAGDIIQGTIEITENGTYDVASYADADVNVPAPTPSLQSKTKSYTPSETAQSETVSADSGYDGLSSVKVNVGAISSTYVGSGIARKSSTDLTVSGATVTAPAGYYADSASKSVASGTAGTPTASKGTVSNHAISVTPSVTNTTGYISGGTKTGTAVSVAASELVSGTYTVSASGTADVTNYASISVPAQTLPTSASSTSSGTSKATISRSTSDQYINIPTGYNSAAAYYKVSAVANGTEGTPTATKGTVSNHAISVTPSVTNTAGYISGGTKTGTAVSVSASELVSGTKSITENGTGIDVTNYASVDVAVPTGAAVTISGTGHDARCYVQLNQAGTKYYTDGDIVPFTEGDELYVYCKGSQGGGTITVNGTTVATAPYNGVTYTLSLPTCDITVNLSYGATSRTDVTIPTIRITSNGTHDVGGYGLALVEVPSQSMSGNMTDPIRFFDYDGTLVASYTSVPTSLPSVPSHTGLTNGKWNYTLAQVTTQFNAMGTCDVGANYDTVSGATEIDIELQEGRLHPYLSLAVYGTVTIDWGDNSTDTSTGTSLTTRKSDIHHEYAAAGSYTIKITKTSGTGYSLYCTSAYMLLNKNNSTANANKVYANCVQAVRVGANCTIGQYAFYYCASLESISIPSTVTSIGNYAFQYCHSLVSATIPSNVTSIGSYVFGYGYSLESISIPSTVTSIGNYAFQYCTPLASVSIPSGVTSIGNGVFGYCYSLASVSIPSGVTIIGSGAFSNCPSLASVSISSGVTIIDGTLFNGCYSLVSISIPSDVTSVGTQAFNNCYGMAEYHFKPTTPPTLANINAFNNIQSDCKIYVPTAKLNDYKTAENWSTYADYMVGE